MSIESRGDGKSFYERLGEQRPAKPQDNQNEDLIGSLEKDFHPHGPQEIKPKDQLRWGFYSMVKRIFDSNRNT